MVATAAQHGLIMYTAHLQALSADVSVTAPLQGAAQIAVGDASAAATQRDHDVEHVPLGPAPCDDCWHAQRCGAERLACEAFAYFARGKSESKWRLQPRHPTLERFARIFG